ncbi:MAG: hypothetical protein HOC71_11735, partial [Candidatus Latescibacteria bacterium]|nr:hypothetical protein [Candidatus Latescibacterota bacterium]
SREKDITIRLLDSCGFPHINLGRCGTSPFSLACELPARCARLLAIIRRETPDIMTAIGGTFIAPVGRLTGTTAVTFTDTENATVSNAISFPLTHHLVVPSCYKKPVKRKVINYNGYHELAYLHPKYFSPDSSVLDLLCMKEGEKFVILRFVSWKSGHDVGHSGLSPDMKRKAVNMFSRHARVFISSESELPPDLEPYKIPISPKQMHDALYYATMLYGESATMASECAVLGTPAIYLDNAGRGYTDEQEARYGAVFNFTESLEDQEKSILKGIEILNTENVKNLWQAKRDKLLNDKIDVTGFVADLVEKLAER